ncbi:hypothetical protein GCM10027030_06630 [Luteococcus sediminum]
MPHDDETRTPDELDQLLVDAIAGDPAAFRDEFLRMRTAELAQRRKVALLEAELKKARPRAKEADDLRRRLGEAHGKLEAYKKEYQRLKKDLARVRASRSMKVGRAVLSPVHALGGLRGGRGGTEPTAAAHVGPARPEPSPGADRFDGESALPVGQRSLATLLEEFGTHPSPVTLQRVLSRRWYQHGQVEAAAQLVQSEPELVAGLSDRDRLFTERILGEARLRDGAFPVPPRSLRTAYLPEPGRVMYCVHSTPVFNSNGYSTRTKGVCEALSTEVDLRVVARAGYPWDGKADIAKPPQRRTERVLDGVSYVHLPGSGLATAPADRYLVEAADAFTREALRQRPEMVQAASNFRTALPALVAARRVGVPFVYEVRGFWELSAAAAKPDFLGSEQFELQSQLETLVAREADVVLAITDQVKDDLVRRGVDAARIHVAPNAVNPEVFLPLPRDVRYAQQRKIRTDVPVIGFAGSLVGYEGLDTLLEASALLEEREVEHQVVIAGSGSELEALKKLRDERGLREVLFLGRLPQEEMPRLISTFDIMPLPRHSLPVTEMVSPLKPLEAFASMKAVVMSDVAPHRDLAGPDQDRALLFTAGSAEALADALQRLVEAPSLRQDLGRAARLWTLDERRWSHVAQTMTEAQRQAREVHRSLAIACPATRLGEVRVGLVADEFTTSTLSASLDVTPLDRHRWADQLEESSLDAVLIESAWSGNGGQWHRGIGDYGDEEHADIVALLEACRQRGIPTAFWNKEDPVHFDRFRSTASLCDHVFTTDADMVPHYLATPGAVSRTASAMPFYAQPLIHNPLPSEMAYHDTVAYAGTYYGDRYKDRSRQLLTLLQVAQPLGLTIYDRQASLPDSPYRFPAELDQHSVGSLPYDQVIHSYKAHLAHLNVNSVGNSPSMYSRRVVEIAACGGVVLSGPGRGVDETFAGLIPTTGDPLTARTLLGAWKHDPQERVAEAWRQLRAVHRSHTIATAITVMLRTMGLAVAAPERPSYGLVVDGKQDLLEAVLDQSQPPLEVFVDDVDQASVLAGSRIAVRPLSELGQCSAEWIGHLDRPVARTHFEDLLTATAYGDWERIGWRVATGTSAGEPMARPVSVAGSTQGLVLSGFVTGADDLAEALRTERESSVELLLAPVRTAGPEAVVEQSAPWATPRTVLVAGHDLKFATGLVGALEEAGHTVLLDQWQDHSRHDEERSLELLEEADVVFCEWGLGNAVWYSQHVRPGQRLVVRVHSQELFRPYLSRIVAQRVDRFVFVGPLVMAAAIASHGLPAGSCQVVPNLVRADELALPKLPGAEHTLGLVGIVPRSKRLDRALDVLEEVLGRDRRYRLRVKGKQPSDYPWMAQRPEEMAWYEEVYARIDAINAAHPGAVTFDPHGDDMPEWFRGIGIALSTSDFESFHFTVADGAASGALPACLEWPGADLLYPREWLAATPAELADSILARQRMPRDEEAFVREHYDARVLLPLLVDVAVGPTPTH